jgi:hypothetical protein
MEPIVTNDRSNAVTGGIPLGRTLDEQAAAIEALRNQSDVLMRIVQAESRLCGLDTRQANRLAERINHWWLYGTMMPPRELREDELERMTDAVVDIDVATALNVQFDGLGASPLFGDWPDDTPNPGGS